MDPATLAVNVTLCPCVDGLVPLASVVVDAAAAADGRDLHGRDDVAAVTWIMMLYVLSVYEWPVRSAPSVNAAVAGVMSRNCVSS